VSCCQPQNCANDARSLYLLEVWIESLPVPFVLTRIKLRAAGPCPRIMIKARRAIKELPIDGTAPSDGLAHRHSAVLFFTAGLGNVSKLNTPGLDAMAGPPYTTSGGSKLPYAYSVSLYSTTRIVSIWVRTWYMTTRAALEVRTFGKCFAQAIGYGQPCSTTASDNKFVCLVELTGLGIWL
jgi:hypothetical protein